MTAAPTGVHAVGISKSHCASVTLVDDAGRPLWSASEERFTRVKLQKGMPRRAYTHAAAEHDLSGATLAFARLRTPQRIAREAEYYWNALRRRRYAIPVARRLAEVTRFAYRKKVLHDREFHRLSIDTQDFAGRRVDSGFDHHRCHAATAYFCSGLDDAVVLTVDGVGDLLSACVWRGRGPRLDLQHRYFQSEHIAGQSYEVVTAMLGFDPDKHPGKVTGLAAYAHPDPELVRFLDAWLRRQYRRGARSNWFYRIHSRDPETELARLREVRDRTFGRWSREEIAAAIQHLLERDVLALVRRHVANPAAENVVMAGGVFANVKLNQRIKALGFRNVFIQPAMGDEGSGFGAAILAAHRARPFAPYRLDHVYLGPEYGPAEMRAALDRAGVLYEDLPDGKLERRLAELLHQGYIIARFQGRMEFGPRALGNRSILYHAKDPSANDWLNKQLRRSEFMPFAPVTLAEHASRCYHGVAGAEHPAEFMTITFDATERMRAESPACVHVDGTARPQLVRPEINPSVHATLSHYFELSGIPTIINTSFNMHEEPIICTPDEAVKAYQAANLDALAMGDYLVVNDSEAAYQRRASAERDRP